MAALKQLTLCLFLLALSKTTHSTESETDTKEDKDEELVESESKDGKLEIIKRIKKINDDGSYTIGYEADDGSFKIESRDVLGQIKGTYGFLDEEGQIKRVSYSTSNSSEIIAKPEEPSVVQRIPSKTKITSTRGPTTSTQSTTTPSSVVQSIARRRSTTTTTTTTSTTTQRPNYSDVINVSSRTTGRPNPVVYTSAPPRVLVQGKSSISSTPASHMYAVKSEGQLIRPEIVTLRPTELPLFQRLAIKQLPDHTPVTEDSEPEIRGNILRRQLPQENNREYNLQEHLYSLQQSLGHDATDVYSGSVTTGTPRPLFTTTNRPRIITLSSTTPAPDSAARPTVRYPVNYQQNVPEELERNSPEYVQETTTIKPIVVQSSPTSVPVVQIPANRMENQEPLVAIRHPFQRGTILVPLSQLRGRIIPVENMREVNEVQKQFVSQQEQYFKEATSRPNVVEIEQQQAVVRRLPPPPLRPIPVQVDQNGFIREVSRQVPSPYPLPVPITPAPKYASDDAENDIDNIEPPVSTRDFQKLLQQLIMRQSRLERISALARQPSYLQQQRYRPVYSYPDQYYVQKETISQSSGPVQFIQRRPDQDSSQQRLPPRQFFEGSDEQRQTVGLRSQAQNVYDDQYEPQSYRPNRRVARLLPSRAEKLQEGQDEYLPAEVREMLLLRMLQLAINPSLPVDNESIDLPTESPKFKRMPVRNVEILGEEELEQPNRRPGRNKRYRESETNY